MSKPKKFDYNQIVIGAGSAGLVTSYICAVVGAKVALIEKHKMGGDCLNTGCVPSKALIKSSKVAYQMRVAHKYGLEKTEPKIDFKKVMERVHDVIKDIEPHDSIERYEKLGVECLTGEATIRSQWEVEVNGKVLTTKNITIATGARPFVPPIEGLKEIPFVTSDTLWNIKDLPKNLLVVGGGPIGCELAQAFSRLGSKVIMVEKGSNIMGREDKAVSEVIEKAFIEEGITILNDSNLKSFKKSGEDNIAIVEKDGLEEEVHFDLCLMAIGRKANTKGFGLEDLDKEIEFNDDGTLKVDKYLRLTKYKNIYAAGDVAGPFQFTHVASHQAWYASVNSLFSPFYKVKTNYDVIPRVTFTSPEVASVGLSEKEAKEKNIEHMKVIYELDDLDRAIAESEIKGFVQVLVKPNSDKILGATIVGASAGDMLLEFTSAMKNGFGLNKIMGTIHPYPTLGEANKFAASTWKNATKPEWAIKLLTKFHSLRR
jgi:pyruvate/2-oxoglutarate dehydrogenase complex dihydrolipoamide dehydrogenase (E3) component